MLRYTIFLMGVGVTNTKTWGQYAGITLGLQGKSYKITTSLYVNEEKPTFNEITVNYFF